MKGFHALDRAANRCAADNIINGGVKIISHLGQRGQVGLGAVILILIYGLLAHAKHIGQKLLAHAVFLP